MKTRNKIFIFAFAFILLLNLISASCNETQIDINTANLTELDRIKWVGQATAESIISYRENNEFDSIDELLNVSGIGLTKLSDIKAQGLACVDENEEKEDNGIKENASELPTKEATETIVTPTALNIKSEDNKEILKRNLAIAGIISFCTGFGALFLLKKLARRKENEFR